MRVKRTLALSALLIFVFAVPVLAAHMEANSEYGYAYLQTNTASGMRNAEAGVIRKEQSYWSYLNVKRTYDDGSEVTQKTGNVQENPKFVYGWEWVESYRSIHKVYARLPYVKMSETFYD